MQMNIFISLNPYLYDIINLKSLITNIEKFLLCKECVKERDLQIKLKEGKEQENFIAYVEAYFKVNPSDKQKGIKELHQDFKKQKSYPQTTYHHNSF